MIPDEQGTAGSAGELYDALTGLVGLALFKDRLDHALLRMARADNQLGLFVFEAIGLRHVKAGSDNDEGETVLRSLVHRMRGALRKVDTLARVRDERFAVIAEDLRKPGDALLVARKLEDALVQPVRIEDRSIEVEIRGGISVFPFDGTEAETLWAAAEGAGERARASATGGFLMADPELVTR